MRIWCGSAPLRGAYTGVLGCRADCCRRARVALGGGSSWQLSCDLIVADRTAVVGCRGVFGVIPGAGVRSCCSVGWGPRAAELISLRGGWRRGGAGVGARDELVEAGGIGRRRFRWRAYRREFARWAAGAKRRCGWGTVSICVRGGGRGCGVAVRGVLGGPGRGVAAFHEKRTLSGRVSPAGLSWGLRPQAPDSYVGCAWVGVARAVPAPLKAKNRVEPGSVRGAGN